MRIPDKTKDRFDLWEKIINQTSARTVAEIGVWEGDFSAAVLEGCSCIENYLMIDPWAQLPDWNKPFNVSNKKFNEARKRAMRRTEFASWIQVSSAI